MKQFRELTILQALELLYTSKKKNKITNVYFVDLEDAQEVELIGVNYESSRPYLIMTNETERKRKTCNRVFVLK